MTRRQQQQQQQRRRLRLRLRLRRQLWCASDDNPPPTTPTNGPNPTLAPSLPLTPYESHQALQRTSLELRAQLANANAAAKATLTLGPSGVALPG